VQADPLVCVWLPTGTPRSDRVVLEANASHWNTQRGPRLERVIFRNDLSPAEALDLVCTTEGAVDLVTEVAPAHAQTVSASEHAKLVRVDAMRVLVGVINRDAEGARRCTTCGPAGRSTWLWTACGSSRRPLPATPPRWRG
jgi:hypothetical protein